MTSTRRGQRANVVDHPVPAQPRGSPILGKSRNAGGEQRLDGGFLAMICSKPGLQNSCRYVARGEDVDAVRPVALADRVARADGAALNLATSQQSTPTPAVFTKMPSMTPRSRGIRSSRGGDLDAGYGHGEEDAMLGAIQLEIGDREALLEDPTRSARAR